MEQLPRQFGRYTLRQELGRGGMGAVYLAHDSVMNAEVAIKLPHFSGVDGGHALDRFYREARVMFGLRHPGICPVHDVGEIDGQHFLVMAFIHGTTLSGYLKKHPKLNGLQAAKLIRKVALGVQAAHDKGIIHRDLKPANIMLEQSGEPVVMDFGLAHADASADSRITRTGTIMGTPAYMPPEQADGSLLEQGPHTDVYSLGVVLYETLTGRIPFEGAITSILAQIARDEPTPPMVHNPQVDQQLNDICLKAMAKKPANRYPSMKAFAEALAAYSTTVRERSTMQAAGSQLEYKPQKAPTSLEKPSKAPQDVATISTEALSPSQAQAATRKADSRQTASSGELDTQAPYRQQRLRKRTNGGSKMLQKLTPLHWAGGVLAVLLIAVFVWWQLPGKRKQVPDQPGAATADGSTEKTVAGHGPSPAGESVVPAPEPFDATVQRTAEEAQAVQQAWAKHLGVPVEHSNSLGMKFVLIPPGEYIMGNPPEEAERAIAQVAQIHRSQRLQEVFRSAAPQHRVTLTKPFYLSIFEVTQAEYRTITGASPSFSASTGQEAHTAAKVAGLDTSQHPVEGVSWNDAVNFCLQLSSREKLTPCYSVSSGATSYLTGTGYRLPTEAEWEYACRAGTTTMWWTGDDPFALLEAAWVSPKADIRTYPVGQLRPNPFGLYDVHGNNLEWVQDWWGPAYYAEFAEKPAVDPLGPAAGGTERVMRGGAWLDPATHCRSAVRHASVPTRILNRIGFRVALSVDAVRAANENKATPANVNGAPPSFDAKVPRTAEEAQAAQAAWAKHLGREVVEKNSIGMDLVLIPPGEFLMGSPDSDTEAIPSEKPQHRVRLTQPLLVGKTEVTQGEWMAVMVTTPWKSQRFVKEGAGYPATDVSHEDAVEFCRKLGAKEGKTYRLLTEAEWEYACRAGTTTNYAFGNDAAQLGQSVWSMDNTVTEQYAHAVATKKANAFGLYDMHGNVWEWCQDWYDAKYYASFEGDWAVDPTGPNSGLDKVLRGGCWNISAGNCRSANRNGDSPGFRFFNQGFRVAQTLDVSAKSAATGNKTAPDPSRNRAGNSPPPFDATVQRTTAEAQAAQQAWAKHLGREVVEKNSIGMDLVLIPPGEFLMGSPDSDSEAGSDEKPQHRVRLTQPLLVGKTEVTRGEFAEFVRATGDRTEAETDGNGGWGWNESTGWFEGRDVKYTWKNTGFTQADDHPVVNVTWNDAVKFCEWLTGKEGTTYRLLREAEWEYACRAGTVTRYFHGDDPEGLAAVGNVADGTAKAKLANYQSFTYITSQDGYTFTAPAARFAANAFGLYDMHGNVWEWCQDWYDEKYYAGFGGTMTSDPAGAVIGSFRLYRGGCWYFTAGRCRSADRDASTPGIRGNDLGFRVAQVPSRSSSEAK